MATPSPDDVGRAFSRAAHTYDQAAHIQRHACHLLLRQLTAQHPDAAPATVLDAGCGTGYGLPLLAERYPAAHRIALDLAPAMLAHARPHAHLALLADVHRLPLAPASLGLYWSSLTLQWCRLDAALAEARRTLRPHGLLAIATLGGRTFHQLRQAFAAADNHPHTIEFPDPTPALHAVGLQALHIQRHPLTAHYPDLRTLLTVIRQTGANHLPQRRPSLLGRHAWQRLHAAYEALRQPEGLPLTYDVYLITARNL